MPQSLQSFLNQCQTIVEARYNFNKNLYAYFLRASEEEKKDYWYDISDIFKGAEYKTIIENFAGNLKVETHRYHTLKNTFNSTDQNEFNLDNLLIKFALIQSESVKLKHQENIFETHIREKLKKLTSDKLEPIILTIKAALDEACYLEEISGLIKNYINSHNNQLSDFFKLLEFPVSIIIEGNEAKYIAEPKYHHEATEQETSKALRDFSSKIKTIAHRLSNDDFAAFSQEHQSRLSNFNQLKQSIREANNLQSKIICALYHYRFCKVTISELEQSCGLLSTKIKPATSKHKRKVKNKRKNKAKDKSYGTIAIKNATPNESTENTESDSTIACRSTKLAQCHIVPEPKIEKSITLSASAEAQKPIANGHTENANTIIANDGASTLPQNKPMARPSTAIEQQSIVTPPKNGILKDSTDKYKNGKPYLPRLEKLRSEAGPNAPIKRSHSAPEHQVDRFGHPIGSEISSIAQAMRKHENNLRELCGKEKKIHRIFHFKTLTRMVEDAGGKIINGKGSARRIILNKFAIDTLELDPNAQAKNSCHEPHKAGKVNGPIANHFRAAFIDANITPEILWPEPTATLKTHSSPTLRTASF